MIIIKTNLSFNTLTQNHYNSLVNLINLNNLTCPNCGDHTFHHHGSYQRVIKDGVISRGLNINRIKCIACGSTHAIFLYPIVPFSQYVFVFELLFHQSLSNFFKVWIDYIQICKVKKRKYFVFFYFPT